MYWIHISRLFSKQSWKWYWIAKPLYLPLQIFRSFKTIHCFGLLGKNPNENETAPATSGRLTALTVARFVCVSVYSPLLTKMRTLRSKLLLGKNVLNTYFTNVLKTVVKMVLNTYFTTVFKTVVKMVLDRQTLIFTVANVRQY